MIEKIILDTVSEYSLFKKGDIVTVALSGGADSVALLYALNQLKDKLGITLKAVHLNHQIRGDEALRDENFAKDFCGNLNIPLICERIDVPQFAKSNNLSLETAARKVRYNLFERVNEGVIATAHTASDNLETMLLNLARGTALDGLCGIPIKRDYIVRPIIGATREQVEKYCKANDLKFITDSTNLTDDYTRNKIRHKIVPVLKEINPKVESLALKTSKSLSEASTFIKQEAKKYIADFSKGNYLSVENFKTLSPTLAKNIIIEFVKTIDCEISLENSHIESIYKNCLQNGKTSIPKDKFCVVNKGILSIGSINENEKTPVFNVEISEKQEKINNLFLNNSLDCDKIIGNLVVRSRKAGDSIRLANRGCTKPLTKLYNEYEIPVNIRDTLPVIADDKGVVWIHGIGVAERCFIKENTKQIYLIEVKENEV